MLRGIYDGSKLQAQKIGFRKSSFSAVWIGALLLSVNLFACATTISTFAGNPVPTGTATNVGIGAYGIAINAAGDVYHSDASNHAVHKIDHTTGISTVIAGTGSSGSTGDGGAAASARLNATRGMTIDSAGNVYIADTNNHRIRMIDTSGNISTIAGVGLSGSTGDTGLATAARINFPQSVKLDSSGNLYIADTSNHRIRKVDTSGIITTFAGTGIAGSIGDGGAATSARLNNPRSIAFDSSGNMYIADTSNHRIRKIDTSGNISTYAGSSAGLSGDGGAASSAQFSGPQGIFIDSSDNIYVADTGNSRIRKIDTSGNISTIAGTSSGFSGDGGAATGAQLAAPVFAALDGSGNLYIADTSNNRIRKVDTSGDISTYAGTGVTTYGGDGGVATMAQFSTPQNVAVDSAGNVYMADSGHHRIRKIDTSGNISTYAGTGTAGLTGDGGPATSARINTPLGLAVDSADNLYIAEGNNSRIRKVDTSGNISTVAGTSAGFSGDGGAATSAQINSPFGVGVDSAGNIYIGDTGNQRIRKVDTSGNISTIGGTGSAGSGGDGGAATAAQINTPMQVVVNSAGEVYFVDYGNSRIRKIDTSGNMQAFAGTGVAGLSGDGGAATSAQLNSPRAVIVASDDTVYIADTSNSRIRHVDGSGNISTVAGTSSGYSGDGGDATLAQLSSPQGVAVSSTGILYIGDTSNRRIRRVLSAVVPDAPTIGTATAGDAQATVTFTAPASDGGAAITTYTATSSPGGFTGTCAGPTACSITVTGLTNGTSYTFTVTATNSVGTGSASAASNAVTPKTAQTITFANPGAQNFGTTPTLTATADSGLTVTFSSSTTGVCTITSGGALTFVSAGTCTIDADQAGNGTYAAAPTVSRSFSVNAVVPDAPIIGTATAGDASASVSFTAPTFTGGASITGYTVTSNPGGITGTGASSPVTVSGLANGTSYTFTVTATNSAGTGSASTASNAITPKAAQTITFANPGAQNFGTAPTLTATADSSLTVTFSSSTTGVCTITSGGALTFVTVGTCTIDADQAGNGTYAAAPTVSRSFTVNAVVPDAPTIGTATAGDTQATVTFSAPAFTGGAAITLYTVTSNPGGITGTGAASPIIVTGLTNGIAYTFTVTADNSAGTSAPSAASNSITPNPGPEVVSVAVPADGSYKAGTNLDFTITWDSNVTVTGTPHVALTIGVTTVQADYVSSPTATTTLFRYTVLAGQTDTNGITVGALTLNGGTIQNSTGIDATLTLNSVASTASVLVDTTAPTLPAANIVVNNQSDPHTVVFTFSETLDIATIGSASDWTVTGNSGLPTYQITSVGLSSSRVITLTLAAVDVTDTTTFITNAAASAHLKVTPPSTLADVAGNTYAAGQITEAGATHMLDSTAPTLSSISTSSPTASGGTLNATASEKSLGYWIAVASGAAAPTVAQVQAGITYDPGSGPVAVIAADHGALPPGSAGTLTLSGLSAATAYDIYVVAVDAAGNSTAATSMTTLTTIPAVVVTTSGGATAWTESNNLTVTSTPVVIDSGITVTDPISTTLTSATVSITGGFQSSEDVLAFTNDGSTMGDIAGSYTSGTGVLALTSSSHATLAQWQAALRTITYNDTAQPPTGTTRTISFQVNDGSEDSLVATKSINLTIVNHPPSFTLGSDPSWPAGTHGLKVVTSFASVTSFGQSSESGQAVSAYHVTDSSDPQGVIDGGSSGILIQANGTLLYSLSGQSGTATISVTLQDNGGTSNGGNDTSTAQTFHITVADGWNLSVTMDDSTNGEHFFSGGDFVDYVITIENIAPSDVHGATVQDLLPAELSSASWTCITIGASTCTASGVGDINDTVSIPSNGGLIYHLMAVAQADPETTVTNTVTVTTSVSEPDSNLSNNMATSVDQIGIYRNGFE